MKKIIVKDIIYGDIELDNVASTIIKTTEFQRLRKIKQLGLSYIYYPSANHTRYEHSIGVYHLAKVVMNLHNKNNEIATEKEEKEFIYASLLHDIGHGPFSHTGEMFYGFNHEKMGIEILENENGVIHKILKEKKLLNGVCSIINKTHSNNILNKLLSSGVDIDRMDYLNRDSFLTGFEYGKIKTMDIISKFEFNTNKGIMLFDKSNLMIAENFIMCRYYMFSEIYLNDETRIFEGVLNYILNSIKDLDNNSNFTYKDILKSSDEKFGDYIQTLVELNGDDHLNQLLSSLNNLTLLDNIEYVKTKEQADLVIDGICKPIIDDKNPIYITGSGPDKKLQTNKPILREFNIDKDPIYIKFKKGVE